MNGWTALMFSCKHGHERVMKTLLNGGATVDMQAKVLLYSIAFLFSIVYFLRVVAIITHTPSEYTSHNILVVMGVH